MTPAIFVCYIKNKSSAKFYSKATDCVYVKLFYYCVTGCKTINVYKKGPALEQPILADIPVI